jgi:hypothetical protein
METMNEEEIINQHLDNVPRVVSDTSKQLREDYAIFNQTHFQNSLPHLSESFICVFQEMRGDNAGMYISPDRAEKMSTKENAIRPGIRINSKLKDFTPHVRIVLLHEMIHACGIVGHKEDFRALISALVKAGVYEPLL